MKNKLIGLLMAVTLVFIFGAAASAATITNSGECGKNGDNLTWTLDDNGTLTISGEGDMYDAWSSYDQPWRELREKIKSVVIENGVIKIAHSAFAECSNLKQVQIPDSVTYMPMYVFEDCASLEEINIPKNVELLDTSTVFEGCSSLKTNNNTYCSVDGVLYSKDMKSLEAYPEGKTDETYRVPDGVEEVGYVGRNPLYPFTNNYIKKIYLPESVKSIGIRCSNLVNINMPENITEISIICPKLTEFDLPAELNTIWDLTCGAEHINLPDSVTTIQQYAFSGCEHLTYIVIPKSVTEIFTNAFDNCLMLNYIYYGGSEEDWDQTLRTAIGGPYIDYREHVTVYFNSSGPKPPKITGIQKQNDSFTVNLSDIEQDYDLITAVYDNDTLQDIKIIPIWCGDTSVDVELTTDEFDKIKAFIWTFIDDICPACESLELNIN